MYGLNKAIIFFFFLIVQWFNLKLCVLTVIKNFDIIIRRNNDVFV